MTPRKKATKQSAKRTKNQRALFPAFILGGIVALSLIITMSLQNTTITTGSSAKVLKGCEVRCSSNEQCGLGMTCKVVDGVGKCKCGTGNCIQRRCILSTGTAVMGSECTREMTRLAQIGKPVESPRLACKDGLGCIFVSGKGSRCCDPANLSAHPECK